MLNGKIALVTGGGRGIGRGICEKFLAAGAQVVIAQRQPLDGALSDHPNVTWVEADLAVSKAPATIAAAVADKFVGLDILVNNAGIMFESSLDDMAESEWDRMMAINLRAPVFLVKYLLPLLRGRGGSVINISSIEGLGANPLHTAYCTSKAGVHGLTRALAVDLGTEGIRCNAIAPGWINSALSKAYLDEQLGEGAMANLLNLHPAGRLGEPADIGDMALFLASDAASFITGQVMVVDGGRTIKLPLPQ
ncbi:SDR family NAD(P)-dependent oxidoreductase [Pseudomonas sp. CC120222-01a]|uniref:SDR family NAD(P)-dependent oxidoreductase n=1 Tax=Pseudomonas sp. CC120222-01a TaxID=1378075 RepID=UPI000D9EC45B|nr:glucose 1-dehydrogenase [Pseudomonas sp. CC120222-01a]PVZ41221.1 NAD(P)-dependent dehydrogenase (short-subunit alcohol dehydrogenase family) [Pseudomonas sp. CC120222-01a]